MEASGMSGHYCKHCDAFHCEIHNGTGEPLDFRGYCYRKRKAVDADDFCNDFKIAKWCAKKERESIQS